MTSDTGDRRRLTALALAALLFLLGAAAGIAVDRLILGAGDGGGERRRRGPPTAEQILERYRERLGLDAGQVAAIRPILERRVRETGGVFERMDPELERIRRAGDDQVRALLRPEQRPRFDQLRAEFEARRAEVRRRLRGGAAPPAGD